MRTIAVGEARRPSLSVAGAVSPATAALLAPDLRRPSVGRSLSTKLLLLTILFVMVAEVLIYVPSIANFRNMWLQEKLDMAAIAAVAATASGGAGLPSEVQARMIAAVGVQAIALRHERQRWLVTSGDVPGTVDAEDDLTSLDPVGSIRAAFGTLVFGGDRTILVRGAPPTGGGQFEILLSDAGLRSAMLTYSRNILLLSLAISVITAALVYIALQAIIVRPIQRLVQNVCDFSTAPEDPGRAILPSGRRDEIGMAEERLAAMQSALRETLNQRRRLADLGLAVSKINHDLRNILASAQLFSDRLAAVDDPIVKRFAPKVVGAIDRAVGYTRSVLAYGSAQEAAPRRRAVSLTRLVDDVADVLGLTGHERIGWESRLPATLEADADADQLFRVAMNLMRNAAEALGGEGDPALVRRIWAEGERRGGVVSFRVCDTGPGVPAKARAALFQPFQGCARPGGTGLGLAIAAEIVSAHGGQIALLDRPGAGAVFEVTIPDRPVNLQAVRQARQA